MHVMIDIETLSTRPDAAIVQIGAVMFEFRSGGRILNDKTFGSYVAVQDGAGVIDNGTLAWWLKQRNAPGLGVGLEDAPVLYDVLTSLQGWPESIGEGGWGDVEGVWAKPADFDLAILKSGYARFGSDTPWARWTTRCAKTLFEVTGGTPEVDWTGLQHHDAVDDAIGQAMQVQKAIS